MTTSTQRRSTSPPAFLQLAGHPLRWRLLTELARSDRRVHELTALVGEPQNLVSYHLGKLRRADLVSTRRSSADGRDSYYSVDLARVRAALTATGVAVHPGMRLVTAPADDANTGNENTGDRPRVLFLCTGNSARSQIAEALLELRSGNRIEAASAGSKPKPLHANAVRVMDEEYGIDLSTRVTKHVDEFSGQRFDRVVTLCDRVREVCPEFPAPSEHVHWSLADPSDETAVEGEGDEATYPVFVRTAAELDSRIEFLVAAFLDHTEPIPA